MKLRYREDGTFRIMQLTDTHLGNRPYNEEDLKTFTLIKNAIEYFDVDLVLHTGDVIWSEGVKDADLIFEEVMQYLDKSKVPVALTFGNHDSEEIITRKDIRGIFKETVTHRAKKNNVFLHNDRECYTIQILDQKEEEVKNVIYMIDSGAASPLPVSEYDWNQPEQVQWFRETSEKYKKSDNVKRNIVFQHIPIPEYWQASENIIDGVNAEVNGNVSSPYINTGLFANMLLNNETWGMIVGHNHDNNYHGLHNGINLVFGNVSGFNTYGKLERGVRIVELTEKSEEIKTYTVGYSQFKK